jgi:uncharacterized protein YkwD
MSDSAGSPYSTRRARWVLVVTLGAVSLLGIVVATTGGATSPVSTGYDRPPNEDEYAMLALANMARSQPSLDGGHETPLRPYVWNDGLAKAARYHSWDELIHRCAQHDSCNGEAWWKRIQRYYPGWSALGENIGSGIPLIAHEGWMASPEHRANVLSPTFYEFGAGAIYDDLNPSHSTQGTEDFGSRGALTIPTLPSGTVLEPRFWESTENGPVWHWQVLVNFYDADGRTPTDVKAYVDGAPVALSRIAGTNSNGTWGAFVNAPGYTQNGPPTPYCKRVYFRATRGDGQVFRYPATDDIGLGFAAGCEFRAPHNGAPPGGGGGAPGAPTVTILSPANGATVSGTVAITASATDDTKVTTIEIYVDGRRLVRRHTSPVTRNWNAGMAAVKPGPHGITVKAYDDAGHVGTATVTVTK